MRPDFPQARQDVIVVGGGIHGAAIFHTLCRAGYKTLLLERDDFGQATSANNLKILHGGLRYLQHANIRRMRESILSRRTFMQLMPHLVRPVPFLVPTRGWGINSRFVMSVALWLNDLVGFDRNRGIDEALKLQGGRVLGERQWRDIAPGFSGAATGAAQWYDALALNPERMCLEFAKSGVERGGTAINHAEVQSLLTSGKRVSGVRVRDSLNGNAQEIESDVVINAAGPWLESLAPDHGPQSYARAVNLLVDCDLFDGFGVGLEGGGPVSDRDAVIKRDKRLYFFVPWRGMTMIGTTYQSCSAAAGTVQVAEKDITDILNAVNSMYPGANLKREQVAYAHVGLVPTYGDDGVGEPQLLKHSRIIDHSREQGLKGLLSIAGVKFTTAPAVAEDVLQKIRATGIDAREKQKVLAPARPLESATKATWPHLQEQYGADAGLLAESIGSQPEQDEFISNEPPLTRSEVLFSMEREFACRLTDVLFRRTLAGSTGAVPPGVVESVADIMANRLGWDEGQRLREIEEVASHEQRRGAQPTGI